MSLPSPLPPLTADEQAHSDRLTALIRDEIDRHDGWLSFERFMELSLYAPGLGYYSAGARKLGADGDFVTAPEISPLFSRCLARQCAQVLSELGGGDILELGAGSGVMATDILLELESLQQLPQRYFILEVSADLRERQKAYDEASARWTDYEAFTTAHNEAQGFIGSASERKRVLLAWKKLTADLVEVKARIENGLQAADDAVKKSSK